MSTGPAHAAAIEVIKRLRVQGHLAYLAGGCVRDILLGVEPRDFDVATDARPERIAGYFRKTASVGAAFGVMLVRDFGPTIEVASFRSDGVYSDARRPDSIEFSDPEHDARRRDFTINALFMDPFAAGEGDGERDGIIDHVGGLADIRGRVLRAVGEPDDRLAEDHLRALRAVRFAAAYGLTIEARTRRAIRAHASELSGVSVERIGAEMRRMLAHGSRARACVLIDELALAGAIFADGRRFDPRIMEALPARVEYPVALAALAIGRDPGALEHEPAIVETTGRLRRALDLSNAEAEGLGGTLGALRCFVSGWDAMDEAQRKRLAGGAWARRSLPVLEALDPQRSAAIEAEIERLASRFGGLGPDPLLDGGDLIDRGLAPGPAFKGILGAVYDAQLRGEVHDRAGAIEMALRLSKNRDKDE